MTVKNYGNELMALAILDDDADHADRQKQFVKIIHLSRSLCYQMLDKMPPVGSGTPSPLYKLNQIIEMVEQEDKREGCTVSYADILADYPRQYLDQLRGGVSLDSKDSIQKLNELNCCGSDALFLLAGRFMHSLSLDELRELYRIMVNARTLAKDLAEVVGAIIGEKEKVFTNSPTHRASLSKAS